MNRREVIVGLALPLLGRGASAQQQRKLWRIGYVWMASERPALLEDHVVGGFFDGMRDLGYVEGRDFLMESRFASGQTDRIPELTSELVRTKVDIILAGSSFQIQGAKRSTSNIPIVMILATDPVASGLVDSLARPGGNITGLSNTAGDFNRKQLELLANAVQGLRRVGIISDFALAVGFDQFVRVEAAARLLGVSVTRIEVPDRENMEGPFAEMIRAEVQGFLILTGSPYFNFREKIASLATSSRLAWMSNTREEVIAGALISYGQNVRSSFRQGAAYVNWIMKGLSPAELPIQQPTKFEITVNLKTAKMLGLTIPDTLLARADEVIE